MVIDTDEGSFQKAAQQIIPPSTFAIIVAILILVALFSGILAIILYKKRKLDF